MHWQSGIVMKPDGEIGSLLVETKSGRRAVLGKIFIDCSGDADLAKWAGAPFAMGERPPEICFTRP